MSFCSLAKGSFPKICRLCVCVLINKRSFEPFMCLGFVTCLDLATFHSAALVNPRANLHDGDSAPSTGDSKRHSPSSVCLHDHNCCLSGYSGCQETSVHSVTGGHGWIRVCFRTLQGPLLVISFATEQEERDAK